MARSYTFIGTVAGDRAGFFVSSAGDVDGDGRDDLIIGAPRADGGGNDSGQSYLITAADLASADAVDGSADGVIDLRNVSPQSTSYQFVGDRIGDNAGWSVSSAGDVDGDGRDDLIIGARNADGGGPDSGHSYLITAADLASADAADGADGVIDLRFVTDQSTSYEFIGTDAYDRAGVSVSSAGDVDGDGRDDLIIGADGVSANSGASYLITAADLANADAADGNMDGRIDLDNVNAQSTSYQFIGTDALDRAGVSVSSVGDVDGDGRDDLIIGADGVSANSGASYLITAADLASADAADGSTDGVIDLDNVSAQSTSYQFNGGQAGDRAGISVSSAGDVDGDGRNDLIIGAYSADGGAPDSGHSYLITAADLASADVADGSADGVIDLGNVNAQSTSYQFNGGQAGDFSGISVSSAGDVDGDGRDDLIIGAFLADGGGTYSGESYLITAADLASADAADGSADGVIDLGNVNAQSTSYQFNGGQAGDFSGTSVSSAGDVDGDGRDDLIIGAPFADGGGVDSGESYLITAADLATADAADGSTDGIIDLANIRYNNVVEGTSGADLIDSSYTDDPQLDRVDNEDNAAGTNDDVIQAGDGDDTIVASAGNDTIDGGAGRDTYRVDEYNTTSYQFIGTEAGDSSGFSVSSAGDVDGDGRDDLIIGAPYADDGGTSSGESYLITAADLANADAADGSTDGVIDLDNVNAQSTSYRFLGSDADYGGSSVSSAGDVDGDGRDDLIIGAKGADGGGHGSGESYLITAADLASADAADGSTDGNISHYNINAQSTSYRFVGSDAGDQSGISVSSAGDVDGDGRDDLIIGAPYADGGDFSSGESYLITAADLASADAADGSTDGVIDLDNVNAQSTSYRFLGTDAGDYSGISVSSAGDVDGDGRNDLIIGAPNADGGGGESGHSYLITAADLASADAADGADGVIDLRNVSAQSTSYAFIGDQAGDYSGTSVSSAGDVDGDGRDDLIIGAPNADLGGNEAGQSYLITAADLASADAADGADGVIDLRNVSAQSTSYAFIGSDAGDQSGISVSSAGDVDGDGRDDLIIGAEGADGGGADSGESYLITAADLASADAADGNTDGVIDLRHVNPQSTSYQFIGTDVGDSAGFSVSSAGDVDGDGRDDLIIGASNADGGGNDSGESYLITAADLATADAADGSTDGVIDLDSVAQINTFNPDISVQVNDLGAGTVSKGGGATDTFTSVENFVAGENGLSGDSIYITDTTVDDATEDPTGEFFEVSDVSGLDDNAVGTFTPQNGNPTINFGPAQTQQLSDILGLGITGRIHITGGDETGTVGGIAFDNFEEITFGIIGVLCFTRGTMIKTINGERAIETLTAGDRILTMDGCYQDLRWIGSRSLDSIDLTVNPRLKPIIIRADALGLGFPVRDLIVSPQHRILVKSTIAERMFDTREVLIPANKLLTLDGIDILEHNPHGVEYWHMLFDTHQIVWSNGSPTESLFTGPEALKAVSPEGRQEITTLFPEICEADFETIAARYIPEKGKLMKKLAQRHHANKQPLFSTN